MNRYVNFIFWGIVSILMFLLFGVTSGNFIYAFYFLSFFMPVVIITSWVFGSYLVPTYLLKKRYAKFFLFSFYTLVISLDIEFILVFLAFLLMSIYDFQNMRTIIDSYKWMPVVMYFIVLLYGFITVAAELILKQGTAGTIPDEHITVRSERKLRQISLDTILFLESMADYVKIFLDTGETVVTREKISTLHSRLTGRFLRIHRSYIVNRDRLDSYNREEVTTGGRLLPVSRTYKKEFLSQMGQ
ncbi:MAG: LytTR family DNA-binding domain-containing protein [Bacteroidales bacterium]|nr:LytTR family DNA-binding domain-containing protein [Bacteroidales bacterium]MDT8433039.1 LytTR family DNA-binding domain-containing protein [Bacteroidales bacterium]